MVYNGGPLSPVTWKSHFSVVSLGGLVMQQEGSLARAVPLIPHRMETDWGKRAKRMWS